MALMENFAEDKSLPRRAPSRPAVARKFAQQRAARYMEKHHQKQATEQPVSNKEQEAVLAESDEVSEDIESLEEGEVKFSLDSLEEINKIQVAAEKEFSERLKEEGLALSKDLISTEAFQHLLTVTRLVKSLGERVEEEDYEPTDEDAEAIGDAFGLMREGSLDIIETESESLDDVKEVVLEEPGLEDDAEEEVTVLRTDQKRKVLTVNSAEDTPEPFILTQEMRVGGEVESVEAEPKQQLYGMTVPGAHEKFNFNATSFREGVRLAMYRDAEVAQSKEKRRLVDEVLQLLAYVPEGGLSDEVAARLEQIVEQINSFADDSESGEEDVTTVKNQPVETAESVSVENHSVYQVNLDDELGSGPTIVRDRSVDSPEKVSIETHPVKIVTLEDEPEDVVELPEEFNVADETMPETDDMSSSESEEVEEVAETTEPTPVEKVTLSGPEREKFLSQTASEFEKIIPNMVERYTGDIPSPYIKLAEEKYEDIMWSANQTPAPRLLQWLNESGINRDAFESWVALEPEIQASGIETSNRTFKEVMDDFMLLQFDDYQDEMSV